MKATLSFVLPDEQAELDLALNAGKLASALQEFSGVLRSARKYDSNLDPKLDKLVKENDDVVYTIETLEKQFYAILEENGVNPWS